MKIRSFGLRGKLEWEWQTDGRMRADDAKDREEGSVNKRRAVEEFLCGQCSSDKSALHA